MPVKRETPASGQGSFGREVEKDTASSAIICYDRWTHIGKGGLGVSIPYDEAY
jgi:hypothetical protein